MMNKWVKVFGVCILFILALWGCDTTEPRTKGPHIFASALNNNVSLLVKDYGGRDITSLGLVNRQLSLWNEERETLPFVALDKDTWTFLVPLPRHKKGQGTPRNGEYFTSNFYVSSRENSIRLRCIFLYEEFVEPKEAIVYGGSSLTLVRIETEAGEVVCERIEPDKDPLLQLRLKGDVVSIIK